MEKNRDAFDFRTLVKPVLAGLILGAVVTFLMLMLLAVLLSAKDFPASAAVALSSIAAGIGAFFAGFLSARIVGHKGLLVGFITGIMLYLIITLISLAASAGDFTILSVVKLAIVLLASIIGGVCGVNTRKRRKIV